MHCDKTNQCSVDILIPHERAITLLFWHQQWLVGNACSIWNLHSKWPTPFEKSWLWQISAYNVSSVRDGEKVQLWRTGSRPRAFQQTIDGVHVSPLIPPKGGWKVFFVYFLNKIQFQSNKVCCTVSLCSLCCSWQRWNESVRNCTSWALLGTFSTHITTCNRYVKCWHRFFESKNWQLVLQYWILVCMSQL